MIVSQCVKPVRMPLLGREQILDAVLASEIERLERISLERINRLERIERLERQAQRTELPAPKEAAPTLPDDPKVIEAKVQEVLDAKVREVLENGGFLFVKRDQGGEIWEYHRASRDGRPLTGKEAKHPPVYRLVVWGMVTLRCSCPARPAASAPCKHQDALAWSLGLPARKAATDPAIRDAEQSAIRDAKKQGASHVD